MHQVPKLVSTMFILLLLMLNGCQAPTHRDSALKANLARAVPLMGHRNWIVIADSAYPLQSGQGITTIYTGKRHLEAVKTVLSELEKTRHVTPVVHLDSELSSVPESHAPGINAYRQELDQILAGRRVERAPHENIIERLDAAGKLYRILILKTDLALPYTTVFLEMDCGYWNPASEQKLREIMQQDRR